MVPNEAKNLLQEILDIEMHRSLDRTLNATMARLAASGGLNSGRALLLLTEDGTNSAHQASGELYWYHGRWHYIEYHVTKGNHVLRIHKLMHPIGPALGRSEP